MMVTRAERINEALSVLADLGMPDAQLNERSALCLLALLNLTLKKSWLEIERPQLGITPIMTWALEHYQKAWKPNTRETLRRQTMHQFVQAGFVVSNPDLPERPTNSPKFIYQIETVCFEMLRQFGTSKYKELLSEYLTQQETLVERYAKRREVEKVPLNISKTKKIRMSPGEHSQLIKAIWEEFGPRFTPGGDLVYVGDTGEKWAYFDEALLRSLGVTVDNHGKMPDALIYYREKDWLIIAEAVTHHGPVDAKRHEELLELFKPSTAGLVFVTAFPNGKIFSHFADGISWETEVWIADNPTHLVHYNGARFLGPH